MIGHTGMVPSKKEEMTLKKVMNGYGICAFLGLILSSLNHPVTGIENMQIIHSRELRMHQNEMKGFFLFILATAVLYFSLINGYFVQKVRRAAKAATQQAVKLREKKEQK
ncbi:hypothetical protein [Planococcus lenghuensis]|uniref:Uncharacterized protein n=1 Tax=Planococcus lenghuensis TaxID=2213202 RepID=A0A1Q2L080_9BACL|nr:hypothetical protein [Planococcus lenghuensis]AQQ53467.1 hypothetical protein B0X71_10535 [Planococcus lenghuensis]